MTIDNGATATATDRPELTREVASQVAESARRTAAGLGIKITVAVVDTTSAPVLLDRMDGARAVTVKLALGKAKASALWGQPSADLAARFAPAPQLTNALIAQWGGEFVAVGGAVPLVVDGVELGAVGVSGGSAAQDADCAAAGAAALAVG